MQTGARTSRRDRTAIGGSIALHLCALALLASLPAVHAAFPGAVDEETPVAVQMLQIDDRPHTRAAERVVRPLARPRVSVRTFKREPVAVRRAALAAPQPRARTETAPPRPPRSALLASPPAGAVAVVATAEPTLLPTAVPATPTPSPTPTAVPVAGGIGSLAEDWPARAKPDVVSDLAAHARAHAVVRVLVDEHGHALDVTVVSGTLDDALRQLIAAATYIPARCNGLDCEGETTLRF